MIEIGFQGFAEVLNRDWSGESGCGSRSQPPVRLEDRGVLTCRCAEDDRLHAGSGFRAIERDNKRRRSIEISRWAGRTGRHARWSRMPPSGGFTAQR